MSTAELKLEIINRIANLKEERIIKEIKQLLDFELDAGNYALTEPQERRIREAKGEYKNGDTISNDEANDRIQKWLNEE